MKLLPWGLLALACAARDSTPRVSTEAEPPAESNSYDWAPSPQSADIAAQGTPAATPPQTGRVPYLSNAPTSPVPSPQPVPVAKEGAPDGDPSSKPTAQTETELRRLRDKDVKELDRLCRNGDGYACFVLGAIASEHNVEFANAAFWRACDLNYVPEACAIFLTKQAPSIDNPDLLSPAKLLRVVEAACSYQREFCALLADQSLKHAALGDIRGQFPDAVAGFKFGNPIELVKKECAARGARWLSDGSDVAGCTPAPINPFTFGDAFVLLHFCGSSLCEVALIFMEQPHLTTSIMERLRAKYGDAAPSSPATVCAGSYLASGSGQQPFRWTWTDRRSDHTARQISYDFSCTKGETAPTSPTIWYRDVAGTLQRMKEYEEKRSNF